MTIKVCPVCSVSWYADQTPKHMMTCTAKDFVPYPGPKYEQAMTQSDDQRAFADQQRRQQLMPYKIEAALDAAEDLAQALSLEFENGKWEWNNVADFVFDRYPLLTGATVAVDREKLANWFYDTNFDGLTMEQCTNCADALLASGLIRPMPTREEIAEELADTPGSWMDLADAILALMKGDKP